MTLRKGALLRGPKWPPKLTGPPHYTLTYFTVWSKVLLGEIEGFWPKWPNLVIAGFTPFRGVHIRRVQTEVSFWTPFRVTPNTPSRSLYTDPWNTGSGTPAQSLLRAGPYSTDSWAHTRGMVHTSGKGCARGVRICLTIVTRSG